MGRGPKICFSSSGCGGTRGRGLVLRDAGMLEVGRRGFSRVFFGGGQKGGKLGSKRGQCWRCCAQISPAAGCAGGVGWARQGFRLVVPSEGAEGDQQRCRTSQMWACPPGIRSPGGVQAWGFPITISWCGDAGTPRVWGRTPQPLRFFGVPLGFGAGTALIPGGPGLGQTTPVIILLIPVRILRSISLKT